MDPLTASTVPWKISDSVELSVADSQMTINAAELRTVIFDPVLEGLANALNELAAASPNTVSVLLGGALSECTYVSKFIEKSLLENSLEHRIKILKSGNG